MLFLACFKVGRYLVPKINLFHALKLGPQSKESANFFNKSWVIDGTMIVEEYLGTSDGGARSWPMLRRRWLSLFRYRRNGPHSRGSGTNVMDNCSRSAGGPTNNWLWGLICIYAEFVRFCFVHFKG